MSYKSIPHTYQRNGVYYFNRRVPNFAQQHCKNSYITLSLKTKNRAVAASRAERLAQHLDNHWFAIRLKGLVGSGDAAISSCCCADKNDDPVPKTNPTTNRAPVLSRAADDYLRLKGTGKTKKFHFDVRRNINHFISMLGDKNITEYQRITARNLRALHYF